jgi:hypothetical protein
MRVKVVRRGGLAGIPLRGEIDTAELPPEQARLAEAALHALPAQGAEAPVPHPDGFQYEIAFSPQAGAERSMLVNEGELPEELRPVIQTAMGRGTLG